MTAAFLLPRPVRGPDDLDIVAIGEAMVEFNQQPGNLSASSAYVQGFGGDTSNMVIAASRQGARTAYVTRIGDDAFGGLLLDLWRREGVDTTAVQVVPATRTGAYFVTHGPQGHAFTYARSHSAATGLTAADIPDTLLARTRLLHASGISLAISSSAANATLSAMERAAAAGVVVCFDPNVRPSLWPMPMARALVGAAARLCDLFLPGVDDLRLLAGINSPEEGLAWCRGQGVRTTILKDGPRCVWIDQDGQTTRVPAFPVQVVDASGAGDCFDGALEARLAAGDPLPDAVRYAAAAAALSATGLGAVAPVPPEAAVRAFLTERSAAGG